MMVVTGSHLALAAGMVTTSGLDKEEIIIKKQDNVVITNEELLKKQDNVVITMYSLMISVLKI